MLLIFKIIVSLFISIVIIDGIFKIDKNERCRWLRFHNWHSHHGVEDVCKNCGKYRLNYGYALSDVYSESLTKEERK